MDIRQLVEEFLGGPAKIERLPGDASTRRYHRVTAATGAHLGRMIVMELPPDALASDEVTAGEAPRELPFLNVQRHLAKAGLPVPEIYLDAVSRGAVILEDLGDDLFVRRVVGADAATMEAWYGAAVDLMVRMHAAMWPIPDGCLAATRSFDFDLLRWELDHFREWGAEAAFDRVLDADLRARLDTAFDALAAEIAALPRGFVHRDYQSRNLMVRGGVPEEKSLCVIDFQDALEGPRVYDLVALLNDSYVDVPPGLQDRIIARYAAARGLDLVALRREFDLVTVQRKLKDGGRFVFIDRVRGNPAFLPFVDKSFARVRAALARLAGHEPLKDALAAVDPARFAAR